MLTFRIRPFTGKPWYVKVYIFPDNAAMIARLKTIRRYRSENLCCHAIASTARYRFHGKQSRKVGEVYLYEGCSGSAVVSHELLHIALGLVTGRALKLIVKDRCRQSKFKWVCQAEEQLCNTMGRLVKDYWNQWYKYFEIDKAGENQKRKATS